MEKFQGLKVQLDYNRKTHYSRLVQLDTDLEIRKDYV